MRRYTLSVLERQIVQSQMVSSRNGHSAAPIFRSGAIASASIQNIHNDNVIQSQLARLQPSNQVLLKAHYSQESNPNKRPSFFGNILSNIKQEYDKSKEMQDSLKKFRDEAKKLEESDALKEARRKFENIESETSKNTGAIKGQLADKLKDSFDELSKTDAAKKAGEFTQTIGKKAENIGKVAGDAAENISKSGVFKSATEVASTLKEEIEGQGLGGKVYRPMVELRKRKETPEVSGEEKPIEVNTDATGVELHKDSKFYASWETFKNTNPVYNKFVDYRMKYEESDNPMVRGARLVTDKVQDIFGGLFTRTELSEVMPFTTLVFECTFRIDLYKWSSNFRFSQRLSKWIQISARSSFLKIVSATSFPTSSKHFAEVTSRF